MNIYEAIITIILVTTYIRDTVRSPTSPLEDPKQCNPSKYATVKIDTCSEPISPFITNTTLSSKYTTEQLQAFYKINPYTNKPYKP